VLDTFVTRFAYCFFVNAVVIFMIAIIMNTITSEGLPGRQNIGQTTAFRVCYFSFLTALPSIPCPALLKYTHVGAQLNTSLMRPFAPGMKYTHASPL